jgi:molybdopterin molybdotransferase
MISFASAHRLVVTLGERLAATRRLEVVSLADAPGRALGPALRAGMAHPRFDNSSMDGFAVRATDVPGLLEVVGRQAAGAPAATEAITEGTCRAIMTGAPMPIGADAVVPVEDTGLEGEHVRFEKHASVGAFVRRAGSDYRVGDVVLEAGTRIEPRHILALATLGMAELSVVARPRVACITTGREVVGDLRRTLGPSEIYDATGPHVRARLAQWHALALATPPIGDDPGGLRSLIERADADVVISTGAVSMGDHDFVPEVLSAMGAEVIFHRVAIRPGKPVFLARLPSGVPFIGLPGNPASTAACLEFFVRPLLEAMQGLVPTPPSFGILRSPYRKGAHRLRMLARAHLSSDASGRRGVEIITEQPSYKVSPFVRSNGWAQIGEDDTELAVGSLVEVHPD